MHIRWKEARIFVEPGAHTESTRVANLKLASLRSQAIQISRE
jgi:hypothetical protein